MPPPVVPEPPVRMSANERDKKEFNDVYMRVAKARQKVIIDFTVDQINKKKALQSQASKVSRCWTFLKKVFGILVVLGILFAFLRPAIYRKMGWELSPPRPDEAAPSFEDGNFTFEEAVPPQPETFR